MNARVQLIIVIDYSFSYLVSIKSNIDRLVYKSIRYVRNKTARNRKNIEKQNRTQWKDNFRNHGHSFESKLLEAFNVKTHY